MSSNSRFDLHRPKALYCCFRKQHNELFCSLSKEACLYVGADRLSLSVSQRVASGQLTWKVLVICLCQVRYREVVTVSSAILHINKSREHVGANLTIVKVLVYIGVRVLDTSRCHVMYPTYRCPASVGPMVSTVTASDVRVKLCPVKRRTQIRALYDMPPLK